MVECGQRWGGGEGWRGEGTGRDGADCSDLHDLPLSRDNY